MKNRIILFFIFSGILSNSICISQTKNNPLNLFSGIPLKLSYKYQKQNYNYRWKLTDSTSTDITGNTDECDIFLTNRSSMKDVHLIALRSSLLVVEKKGIKREINVMEINKIKFPGSSGFWLGAGIGAGISLLGGVLGLAAGGGNIYIFMYGLVYSVPAGLVGGLIGLFTESDEEIYEISGGNPKAKLKRLKYIINKHTPGKYWPD